MCVLVFFLLPIMVISSWIFVYVQHPCLCSCVVVLVLYKKLADENQVSILATNVGHTCLCVCACLCVCVCVCA